MSSIIVYRRQRTEVRPIGSYESRRYLLGTLVFDRVRDEVLRYTPDGMLIDRQTPSMWVDSSQSFDKWVQQHREFWSLHERDAYFDTDFTVDEGL